MKLALVIAILFFAGCLQHTSQVAAPGEAVYTHEEFSPETGKRVSRTEIVFQQNADPKQGATLKVYGREVSIEWGASHFRKLPPNFKHMQTILTGAGILCILVSLAFLYRTHIKLASLAAIAGIGLIAIAATIEKYAWLYGIGLLAALSVVAWMLWSAYQTPAPNQQPAPIPA